MSRGRPDDAHLLRVEEEKSIASRMSPSASAHGFADFENFERGELETAPVHDGGDAFEQLRAMLDAERGTNGRKPRAAALTARSASGIPASATSPTISFGALGLSDVIHLPVVTFSPSITSGYFLPEPAAHFAQRGAHLFLRSGDGRS